MPVRVAGSRPDHQIRVRIAVILRHVAFRVADAERAVDVDLQAVFKGPREQDVRPERSCGADVKRSIKQAW